MQIQQFRERKLGVTEQIEPTVSESLTPNVTPSVTPSDTPKAPSIPSPMTSSTDEKDIDVGKPDFSIFPQIQVSGSSLSNSLLTPVSDQITSVTLPFNTLQGMFTLIYFLQRFLATIPTLIQLDRPKPLDDELLKSSK